MSKRWSKEARIKQGQQMTQNMNKRWGSVRANPAKRCQESLIRSPYAQSGQPLASWMVDPNVALTHQDLANLIGVSAMTISNWVSGRSVPRPDLAEKLERVASKYPVHLDLEWATGIVNK